MFAIAAALLMAGRAVAWMRHRAAPSWEQSRDGAPLLHRRPPRHHRVGDRRRRRDAAEAARAIVAMLAAGAHGPVAHLDVGAVLRPGETSWGRAQARLATWETQAAQVARSRVRWGGRRIDSAAREVAGSGWQNRGEVDWLITSLRLVGRTHADDELVSIWWSGLAGAQADLVSEAVHFDGNNGWRGDLTGPAVSPSPSPPSPPATTWRPCRST